MKPYFQEDGITIYCADNRAILPHLPKFDLLLTDPPYGLGKKLQGGNWGRHVGLAAEWDVAPSTDMIGDAIDKSSNAIIWGGNYFNLPISRCWLGWIKRDSVATVASLELAWTSFDAPSKYFDCTIARTNAERNGHPTLKPLRLMTWCLQQANATGTVLDPYMGSGTTLVAAKLRGLQATGIETSQAYCDIAISRLSQKILIPA